MKILGIESSCDDTSISIIDNNKNIIVNETISQNKIHKDYNGVVPELAARNHVLFIDKILKHILNKQQKFIGTRIFGSLPKIFRSTKYMKVLSLCSGFAS